MNLRARYRLFRWNHHWRQHRELREQAVALGLPPEPPTDRKPKGERAPELLEGLADYSHSLSEISGRMTASVFDAFAKSHGPEHRQPASGGGTGLLDGSRADSQGEPSAMKVYVLTDGQYEQEVEGVFSSPDLAMAERPGLVWEKAHDEDFPDGFWFGMNGLDMSRVFGFELREPVRELTVDDLKAGCVQTASYRRP